MSLPRALSLLCFTLLVSGLPATAFAGGATLLLAVTEVAEDGEATFWWTSSKDPAWTETDRALRGLLAVRGLPDVDPATQPEAPVISQVVYGHAHLSATNAINLASLFGASRVLTGSVRYEP